MSGAKKTGIATLLLGKRVRITIGMDPDNPQHRTIAHHRTMRYFGEWGLVVSEGWVIDGVLKVMVQLDVGTLLACQVEHLTPGERLV